MVPNFTLGRGVNGSPTKIGLLPQNPNVVYDRTVVTGCHNLLAMEVAGLSGSKLYAGSWSEWIVNKNRPVATGHLI
jgi:thiosulfate/3-mercaptopyruvate sulfurtransferase